MYAPVTVLAGATAARRLEHDHLTKGHFAWSIVSFVQNSMPRQRFTILTIGGVSAGLIMRRFQRWIGIARWSADHGQSPDRKLVTARREADVLIAMLRSQPHDPPVLFWCEWIDMWSMGDLVDYCLAEHGDGHIHAFPLGDREVWAYSLPDGGELLERIASASAQFQESEWFLRRLREAAEAWNRLTNESLILVVRQVLGPCATDEEVQDSMASAPSWLQKLLNRDP